MRSSILLFFRREIPSSFDGTQARIGRNRDLDDIVGTEFGTQLYRVILEKYQNQRHACYQVQFKNILGELYQTRGDTIDHAK